MKLEEFRQKPQLLIGILILFYTVGILLFLIGETRTLFKALTPWSLILSFIAVMAFQKEISAKLGIAFVVIFISTLIIEIIGVNTGALFGNYVYGNALGIQIFHTPIQIGLNWLMLTYCSAAIVNHHMKSRMTRIIVGSVIMVGYDVVLEYVAPVMDMWSWETPYPGIRNFVMWFLVSICLHYMLQKLDLRIENKPARYLFLFQFLLLCVIALSASLSI